VAGKPQLAEAGGKDSSKLADAIEEVIQLWNQFWLIDLLDFLTPRASGLIEPGVYCGRRNVFYARCSDKSVLAVFLLGSFSAYGRSLYSYTDESGVRVFTNIPPKVQFMIGRPSAP